MAQRLIVLTYRKTGTQPPVFVAGTFSDPAWQTYEMSFTVDELGEHIFEKVVSVQAGSEIQYKFRLGTGDWWACDEAVPTATDAQGNLNNVMRISSLSVDVDDFEDEDELSEDACPMFSHECFGSQSASPNTLHTPEEDARTISEPDLHLPDQAEAPYSINIGDEEIDYNDPRLERFPHENRKSIIAQLQRIETSTEPDRSLPEGIPVHSPVMSPSSMSLSPIGLELDPSMQRSQGHRASLGSFHSHTSLASIGEAVDEEDSENLKADKSRFATSTPPPGTFKPVDYTGPGGSQGSADRTSYQKESITPTVRLEAPSDDDDEGVSLSTGNSITKTDPHHLRKRDTTKSTLERSPSPSSVHPAHEVSKEYSWFRALLRYILVDWIGYFVSNVLFGNRRKS